MLMDGLSRNVLSLITACLGKGGVNVEEPRLDYRLARGEMAKESGHGDLALLRLLASRSNLSDKLLESAMWNQSVVYSVVIGLFLHCNGC
jgi:hypothetical protein